MNPMTDIDPGVIREIIAAAKQQGAKAARSMSLRPATVRAIDSTQTLAEVVVDDDPDLLTGNDDVQENEGAVGAQMLYPTGVRAGDRVMIMFAPPQGAFVVGRLAGDYEEWRYVGVDQNPAFGTGWTNGPSTGLPTEDTHATVSFRRLGRWVELRGQARRTSGAGTTIFTLPDEYRPRNRVILPGLAGAGLTLGANWITITVNGVVSVFELFDVDTPSGSQFLDGIVYSVDDNFSAEVP